MTDIDENILVRIGRQAKQGASMGFADEIQDVIGSAGAYAVLKGLEAAGRIDEAPRFSELISEARKKSISELERDWVENPGTSLMANIVGFLPFALGQAGLRATIGAAKAPTAITKAATSLAKANQAIQTWAATGSRAARAAKGASIGLGYGAVSGTGAAGDTAEERLQGAGIGAGVGAVTGSITGAVTRGNPSQSQVARQAAEQASFNKAEDDFLRDLLMRPDLGEMQKRAAVYNAISRRTGIELTLPELLAQTDVDPLLARQAVLTKTPETAGAAQSLLQRRMGEPLAGQPGQINTALHNLSNQLAPGSYDDLAQQLIQRGSAAASDITKRLQEQAAPLYREAMQANKSIASPELDRILETPAGRRAMAQARTIMQNEGTRLGIPDKELGEIAREIGIRSKGGVASGLKLETYDLIKRGLDDMISNEISRSTPGTTSSTTRSLQSLRSRLVSELDRLDVTGITGPNSTRPDGGAYARARAIYSSQPEVLGNRELMGELANIDKLDPQRVITQLYSGTTGTVQRTAQALGPEGSRAAAAAKLQDILGGLKTGSLPPRLDADTVQMVRTYAGRYGQDVNDILRVVERARAGERFLRGSQTQANQAIERGMAEAAGNAALDAATGNKIGLARQGLNAIAEAVRGSNKEQYNRDLLNLFTTPRGFEALNEAVKIQSQLRSMPVQATIAAPTTGALTGVSSRQISAPSPQYSYTPAALDYIKLSGAYTPQGVIRRKSENDEYTPIGIVRNVNK